MLRIYGLLGFLFFNNTNSCRKSKRLCVKLCKTPFKMFRHISKDVNKRSQLTLLEVREVTLHLQGLRSRLTLEDVAG